MPGWLLAAAWKADPAAWKADPAADAPLFDGWETETSASGVFYARRTLERPLTRHEVLAGLTRYLVAHSRHELLRLLDAQRRIAEHLRAGSPPPVCPHCGHGPGEAPLIVTADESSVTAERCARSYGDDGECGHERVEWTYEHPLPDGARCRDCGTWWRLDLIPEEVAARLTGGSVAPAGSPRHADGHTPA
ncbi:hypothetical protein FHS43_003717 [Streptosporangium becharense]|uniref:Uncharacterized protein n=1 Tax=Streptosporangium becharense TaxID=1816182 RepID=A0A7W9MH27_9ACTN|nr:hypothetical protein [Streptosporangium becharense]MBB2912434.1 hypothetical protein [Streptosporangium becharense]MBB5820737.1 hypothetical protein [Streptosporangium becharense]